MLIAVPIGAKQRHVCRVAVALLGLLWLGSPSDALAQAVQFSYSAKDEWAESQIMLFPGDRVAVDTSADWCNAGPPDAMFNQFGLNGVLIGGAYLPDAPLGMALARIGDDIWPAIDRSINVTKPGRLLFAMNDVPGTYGDNRGDATVTIRMTLTKVDMPAFRNRPIAEAEKFFAPLGLNPGVQTGQSDLDEGLIYDQRPQRGADLHRVQPLVLYVSAGQASVAVPDVVGQPNVDATKILRTAGFSPVSGGAESSALPGWRVTRTEPAAQTIVTRGTTVRYWIASGENLVPDVIDQPADAGERHVRAAGFTDVRTSLVESIGHDGVIVEQAPLPYTTAELTIPVELMVGRSSAGTQTMDALVLVPDVVGHMEADALEQLQSNRLIGRKRRAESSVHASGLVTRTDPPAGKTVKSGTRVWYWLASGKYIVPDVTEKSSSSARESLHESGFHNVVDVSEFSTGNDGTVSSQTPPAGLPAELDAQVVLTVRKVIWPYLVFGVLGLGAAGGGTFQLTQRIKRIRTERHVRVHSSLDAETDSALPDEVPTSKVEIKVSLVAGNTEFSQQPEILSNEVRNA
jgi:beta-lactam-binding protein with PASTA domain